MRLVAQRVARAAVRVDGEVVGEIGRGILALVCVLDGDGPEQARRLAERLAHLRMFPDPEASGEAGEGRMNRSALELGLACLVVSQFTLAADGKQGRRPSFGRAAAPDEARALCERFRSTLEGLGLATARGRFGAAMQVELIGDGPVTFVLDCEPRS